MKLFTVLLMVGLAGCAWGQQVPRWAAKLPVVSTEGGIDDGHTKPLKCGKWEHVELSHAECGPARNESNFACSIEPDRCVQMMHSVTEKDWQELLARLKALEDKTYFTDALRAQQCPSLQWNSGNCLPFCDEVGGSMASCAMRPKSQKSKP